MPTVLVRWRLPSRVSAEEKAPTDAALVEAAADQFFAQIGYPRRRALLTTLLARGVTIQGDTTQADVAAPGTHARLLHALRLLFSAAAAVQAERIAQGVPALEAAPVLLFDEAQDLVRDVRLARIGGTLVFDTLVSLLIRYGVDRQSVRSVIAGSSAELVSAVRAAGLYGNRWRCHELADPAPDVLSEELGRRGYTADEARAMLDLCGSRLRLLDAPLPSERLP